MSNFKVSVIIPMFNSEATIIETIKSLVNQTRADLIEEIIIVNDGSTDGSKQTVEQYINESKHTSIKMFHKQNGGVSSARNFGVEQANAEWIAFCDSDDIWLENKLEIQIHALKENKEIAFLGTGLKNCNPKVGSFYKSNIYSININQFLFKAWPQTSTILMKKSLFNQAGGFPKNQKYSEDSNLWIKCLQFQRIFYIREELVNYGNGKGMFGDTGLSANMKEMHNGVIKNMKDTYHMGMINRLSLYFFLFYENIKYLRRIIKRKRFHQHK